MATGDLPDTEFEVYGNILINAGGSNKYIGYSSSHELEFESKNLTATGDIGFVDYEGRDLRITSASEANNFAVGLTAYPKDDFINLDVREENNLDAGAFMVN